MWTILLTFVIHQISRDTVAISTTTIGNYNNVLACQEVADKIAKPEMPRVYERYPTIVTKTAQCVQVKDK